MVNAVVKNNFLTYAFAKFQSGRSVRQSVHDGDTISLVPDGTFSTRLLGVDTPEVSFQFPKLNGNENSGKWITIDKFTEYLADPFTNKYSDSKSFKKNLGSGLVKYLKKIR